MLPQSSPDDFDDDRAVDGELRTRSTPRKRRRMRHMDGDHDTWDMLDDEDFVDGSDDGH